MWALSSHCYDHEAPRLACARTALLVRSGLAVILDSIVVSIPACHAGDRGSIPRRGDNILLSIVWH